MKLSILAIAGLVTALPFDNHLPHIQKVLKSENDINELPTPEFSEQQYLSLPEIDTDQLQDLIGEVGLRERAEKLYSIAEKSTKEFGHPTRVIGSPGHWKTLHYIGNELRKLGGYFTVKYQNFKALDGKINSFSLLIDGKEPKSLVPFSLTPPTANGAPVNGKLVLINNFGCSVEDYPTNLTSGNIALIKRGQCGFNEKSENAGKSGALGAIIFDDEPMHGTLGTPTDNQVATVFITTKDAQTYIDKLSKDPEYEFETTLFVDSYVKYITTLNVIADTKFGDPENVVALGAHSDSVGEGPGINDDGSGTISLLEVAKHLSKFKVNNKVRFAWWAAEEEGLLGSYHYANTLSPEENEKIRLFMDYDMMASPNYEYQIYDANNEEHPSGSGDLKQLYVDFYTKLGLNYSFVPFDGRSDYVGFIDNGIPAGGIAAGAEGVKDATGVEKFGGTAGEWFDKCYHQLCDDLTNPDYEAWVVNTKLIAHSVATYAKSFVGFPERLAVTVSDVSVSSMPYRGPNAIY